jgi:hypothetical protein
MLCSVFCGLSAGTTGEGGHGMGLLMLGNMQGGGSGLGYLSPQAPGPLLHQKSALEASEFILHACSRVQPCMALVT